MALASFVWGCSRGWVGTDHPLKTELTVPHQTGKAGMLFFGLFVYSDAPGARNCLLLVLLVRVYEIKLIYEMR